MIFLLLSVAVTLDALCLTFKFSWHLYCSSMVIRDLTLRSAVSFGSFHLIRLLYDEYMFYLVEHKVAAATSRTPIAVMAEVSLFLLLLITWFYNQSDDVFSSSLSNLLIIC